MKTTSSYTTVTFLAALITAAAGCSGDGSRAASELSDDGAGTLGGGPPGGTVIVLADREPDQLNPVTFQSTPAYQAVHLMFRGLARRDSTLSGYTPDLAQSWAFEDDSTLVLDLRRDVLWHDGTPVTADDVVFTIEMQRDPMTGSARQADVTAVTSVAARDSFTVEVRLARTGMYTVNALLEVVPIPQHLLGDVAPADMRNAPFNRNPVGNGFYRFGGWSAGQSLTLLVNADKPDGRAAIDRIVMRFIPDVNAAVTELLTGQGDLIPKLPPARQARVAAAANAEVYGGPRVRPAWLAFNNRRPPFDDVRVRRALLMGIDREALAAGLFADVGEPAWSPVPTALWEHTPGVRTIPYDVDAARRLLADAGWTDSDGDGLIDRAGRPLRVEADFISSDQTRQDVLVAIQSMLRRIGVDLVPRAYESSTWVQRLRDGAFDISFWGWGWGPGVMGPNAENVFHSRMIPPNGANFAASNNPRMDELIDAVLAVTDTTSARVIWAELEQLMIDDAVYAPIYLDPELFGVHARIRNVKFRGVEWNEDVPYWYVDPGSRLPRDRAR